MSTRFDQLDERRRELLGRCALERQLIGETSQEIELQLGRVDRAVDFVRGIARRPAVIIGAVALVLLIGPRRLLRWAGRGALVFSTARRLQRLRGA